MRLLSRALVQFGGVVETEFEATGLLCNMNLPLPENTTVELGGTPSGNGIVSYG
jgi:hypothetical protein